MVLETIESPQDLKQLSRKDLQRVVDEARQTLLEKNKPAWRAQWTKFWCS